jgi:SH3-like domain-containing protein
MTPVNHPNFLKRHTPAYPWEKFIKGPLKQLLLGLILVFFTLSWSTMAKAKTTLGATSHIPKHSRYAALRSKVNWRSGPGPDHDITWCYESPGWPVVILKKYENWYYIKDLSGACGWVKGSMLSFKPTLVIVKDSILYATPKSTGSKKAKLQKGVIVRYIKHKDPLWLYVMIPEKGCHGWIPAAISWPNIATP